MNEISQKDLFASLKNKRIIIVGPAPEPEYQKGFGRYIDSFDYVVRVNRGWRMSKENPDIFGSRTDILYHCLDFDEESGGMIDYNFLKNLNVKLSFLAIQILMDQISEIKCLTSELGSIALIGSYPRMGGLIILLFQATII